MRHEDEWELLAGGFVSSQDTLLEVQSRNQWAQTIETTPHGHDVLQPRGKKDGRRRV